MNRTKLDLLARRLSTSATRPRSYGRRSSHNLPPGVGKVSDRHAFEMLVRLMAKERADSINNNERGQLIKLLGSFGMTPADRSKISIDSTALDEFQQFLIKPKPVRPTRPMSDKPAQGTVQ